MTYPNQRHAEAAGTRSPEQERRIVRQAVLKAAVEWARGVEPRPSSADVLKVAERFEQWVYR